MIKKNYKKIKVEDNDYYSRHHLGRYMIRDSYYRQIRTFNERKQNHHAQDDGYYVRGKRRKPNLPCNWSDIGISRFWGRSWKDFTKAKKQWMVKQK